MFLVSFCNIVFCQHKGESESMWACLGTEMVCVYKAPLSADAYSCNLIKILAASFLCLHYNQQPLWSL